LPTVERYLEGGIAHANPAFAWCVVWLFDVGNFDQALDWADIAIEQGQSTPENIKSTFATFVADTVMEWAETQASLGHSIEPYFSRTFANIRDKWRLHEEVNAKWYKFAGLLLLADKSGKPVATAIDDVETLLQADALLAQAGAFDVKVGVKTHREKIAARIRALQKV
ncbi:TPA: phage terminase small subunit, partial [Yersinia enterocolitica]